MANKLGEKHVCSNCGAKFYDFGKSDPKCPRCGTSASDDDAELVKAPRAKRVKVEVKPAFEEPEDEVDFTPADDDTVAAVPEADLEEDDDGDDLDDLDDDI